MDPRRKPMDTVDDAELILRVSEGDEAALQALYDRHSRLVYSVALAIVRAAADAEEVAQQVFLRIWDKAENYLPARAGATAWIVMLTRRLAIDRTRSKHFKAGQRRVDVEAASMDPSTSGLQLSSAGVEARVQAREVVNALEQLGPHQREVIELSYFQGLSHAQIAAELSAPLGTIKSRIRDAVARLRRILDVEE